MAAPIKTEAEKLAFARKKVRAEFMSTVNYKTENLVENVEKQTRNIMSGIGPRFTQSREDLMFKKLKIWSRELLTDTYPRQLMGGRGIRNPVVEVNASLDFIKLIYCPDSGSTKPYLVVLIDHKMAGVAYHLYTFQEDTKEYKRLREDIREVETLRNHLDDEAIRRALLV